MGSVCQRCGVTGFEEYLVFCKSCKVHAEHRYCLDVIPKPNDEVEWSCFLCRKKFPEARVKTCNVLVHTNGKKKPIMKHTIHRSKLSRILKERRHHFLQAFTVGNNRPNVAKEINSGSESGGKDLAGVKSARSKSSPQDDRGGNILENSGKKIVSPTKANCGQKHPQPSLSSGLFPDGSKHAEKDVCGVVESAVGKINPNNGKNNVSSPGKVSFGGHNSDVEVHCSHSTSSLARISPNSANQLSNGFQLGGKNVPAVVESSPGRPSPRDFQKDDFSENRKKKNGSPKTGSPEIAVSSEKNPAETNATKTTKRRRLLMDDSDEDNGSLHSIDYSIVPVLPLQHSSEVDCLSRPISPPESSETKISQPLASCTMQPFQCFFPYPAWRGYFNIHGMVYGPIVAHASKTVCEKVFNVLQRLPQTFIFERLPKSDVYPPSFNHGKLTHDRVALYFLPGDPSLKTPVDKLVEELIVHKLALRMTLDVADLLVFSSLLLPQQSWLIENEFYLWGVLRRRILPHSAVAESSRDVESRPGFGPHEELKGSHGK